MTGPAGEPILGPVSPALENGPADLWPLPVLGLGLVLAGLAAGVLVEHGAQAREPGGHSARRENAEADKQQEDVVLAAQVRDTHVPERVPCPRDGPPCQLRGLHARGVVIVCEEEHSKQRAETAEGPSGS